MDGKYIQYFDHITSKKERKKETASKNRRGWEDNIKTDVKKRRWEGVGWICLAQRLALVNTLNILLVT
jgi:hypothetical protein